MGEKSRFLGIEVTDHKRPKCKDWRYRSPQRKYMSMISFSPRELSTAERRGPEYAFFVGLDMSKKVWKSECFPKRFLATPVKKRRECSTHAARRGENRRKELSASVFTKKFFTQMGLGTLGKSFFCVSRQVAVGPFLDRMSRGPSHPTDMRPTKTCSAHCCLGSGERYFVSFWVLSLSGRFPSR